MATSDALEDRIVTLEILLTRQERTIDELNAETLRLNRIVERLEQRLEAHEARQENALLLRPLADEPPPPHY